MIFAFCNSVHTLKVGDFCKLPKKKQLSLWVFVKKKVWLNLNIRGLFSVRPTYTKRRVFNHFK